ncbi:pyrroline-5-carboxylate reductase [Marinomonas sp. GJ51-6]|uniref:pyrroline-5-carboxylate reductase n=1 Tax=Marinomonas sp. GJ51-6 TaxID=2992802 RepID=UPI0029349C87|nr:pyrroline-5-carboxylate reductase [Marinomonas sp. GJ51-6]WOD06693.1 pyrroline-5-carboxylate reductase [Marinomonas sp. GJ51-6]
MAEQSQSEKKILVVGAGRMGLCHFRWLVATEYDSEFYLFNRSWPETLEGFKCKGIHTFQNVEEVPEGITFDVFLLALKPQVIVQHVTEFNRLISDSTCLISVAAGVMSTTLKQMLPNARNVVRVMPNTPAMIGKGVMVGYSDKQSEFSKLIEDLFSTLGRFFWISDENQMHAVTAISGSGSAYLFYFTQCFIESAKTLGLDENLAQELALETVIGAANLIEQSDDDVETLRKNVTSPNGTTQAGLEALMADSILKQRVEACCQQAAQKSVALS